MEWYVIYHNFNKNKIEKYNIFDHYSFAKACKENAKKNSKDKAAFAEELLSSLMYYFWSKCEWEVIVSAWPPKEDSEKKIDVHDQVMLNWNLFVDYCWEHKAELKKFDVF